MMSFFGERRQKNVEKRLKMVEDVLDEHHDLLLNLKKRLMSLEGRWTRHSDRRAEKLLKDILGGEIVAIGGDDGDNTQAGNRSDDNDTESTTAADTRLGNSGPSKRH